MLQEVFTAIENWANVKQASRAVGCRNLKTTIKKLCGKLKTRNITLTTVIIFVILLLESLFSSAVDLAIDSQIYDSESTPYVNLSSLVTKRLRTAHYYLKYSALNSQMEKH